MKIGIDIRVLLDHHYSGVSEYAKHLLHELLIGDDDNQYVLFYNSFREQPAFLSDLDQSNLEIIRTRYPNKIFNYGLQKPFGRPFLDSLTGPVDAFWSPHINFSSFGEQAGRKILTIHDLSYQRYPEFFSHRKNFWHRSLKVAELIKKYDYLVAISENTKVDLMELLAVPEEKIKVIYSGLNKESCSLSEAEIAGFKNKHNLGDRFILYLGTIEPRKNVAGLIQAYDLLRQRQWPLTNYQLVLAGADGWKNNQIYEQAKNSVFRDDIHFLGYVSLAERDWLYRNASLFVYPSYYEGFGFPPLEAMSYGCPTITSDISSIPEVVGSAALLVNPYSTFDLAQAIETMLLSTDLRAVYGRRGLEQSHKFTWQKTAKQYLQLFKGEL
jgi:glycosyltransferase involved in cell wall biosynthesis